MHCATVIAVLNIKNGLVKNHDNREPKLKLLHLSTTLIRNFLHYKNDILLQYTNEMKPYLWRMQVLQTKIVFWCKLSRCYLPKKAAILDNFFHSGWIQLSLSGTTFKLSKWLIKSLMMCITHSVTYIYFDFIKGNFLKLYICHYKQQMTKIHLPYFQSVSDSPEMLGWREM